MSFFYVFILPYNFELGVFCDKRTLIRIGRFVSGSGLHSDGVDGVMGLSLIDA